MLAGFLHGTRVFGLCASQRAPTIYGIRHEMTGRPSKKFAPQQADAELKYARPKYRMRIANPELLRRVLEYVAEKFNTHEEAAARLGIDPSIFSRLLRGQERMSYDTYVRIRESLMALVWELTCDEESVLEQYELPEDLQSAMLPRFEDDLIVWNYEMWLRGELSRLQPKVQPILTELMEEAPYGNRLLEFAAHFTGRRVLPSIQANGVDPRTWVDEQMDNRCLVAIYRALEPLADFEATWGVHRSWREMLKARDLTAFVKVALKREELVLGRDQLIERIRSCEPPEHAYDSLVDPDYMAEETPELPDADLKFLDEYQASQGNGEAIE